MEAHWLSVLGDHFSIQIWGENFPLMFLSRNLMIAMNTLNKSLLKAGKFVTMSILCIINDLSNLIG